MGLQIQLNSVNFLLGLMLMSSSTFAQHKNRHPIDSTSVEGNLGAIAFVVPGAFVAYGFAGLHNKVFNRLDKNINVEIRKGHPNFAFSLDNYLRYVPAVAVYGMDLAGLKSKHNLVDRTAILLLADLMMFPSVGITKSATNRLRPDGSNYHSFPSGHSSMAFMTAEFMHQEYKDDYPLVSLLGYAAASATGVLRIYNGAHWFSDVVAGAGYGIISTKLSYLIYPVIKKLAFHKKPINAIITPVYQDGYKGVAFIHQF